MTDSSPKVLIVDLSNNYGGSSSRVLSLMARAKPGTIALAGLKSGAITRQALQVGLPVHILSDHKADPRLLIRLIQVIRSEGYTLLDSQNIQSKFWANLAAVITRTSLVSTLNSWYANEHGKASLKGKLYTALELLSNQGLDLYITVSEKDRQSLLKSGLPENAVELIYNAVDVDVSAIHGDSEWIRQKFELPPDSMICTAVGRLVPVKGYDVLIEAMQKIAAEVPQLYCLIVGEGQCKEELLAQIRGVGMESRVRLLGYYDRKNAMSILKSSDIFVMPSRYEGTPIALLEAAALGRPILASFTGGIPELVRPDEHALLVPPGDPAALAQGLVRLALDRSYAETLGQHAQQRICQHFNLESQVNATWNAYRKALNMHKAREK
ncbi:MAG TPA: glycosyltransferase family 4 protein [Anaerolineales bacterium]|nr:glycosyltransferase family 4 protein [Anaerolineales bacterium]HLO30303.1 glycosyltransferase family 4 protein [Anaerolineales bacterium]